MGPLQWTSKSAWYEYKKDLEDEEDDTDNSTDLGTANKKI